MRDAPSYNSLANHPGHDCAFLPRTLGSQVSITPISKCSHEGAYQLTNMTIKVDYAHWPPVFMGGSQCWQCCSMISTQRYDPWARVLVGFAWSTRYNLPNPVSVHHNRNQLKLAKLNFRPCAQHRAALVRQYYPLTCPLAYYWSLIEGALTNQDDQRRITTVDNESPVQKDVFSYIISAPMSTSSNRVCTSNNNQSINADVRSTAKSGICYGRHICTPSHKAIDSVRMFDKQGSDSYSPVVTSHASSARMRWEPLRIPAGPYLAPGRAVTPC